MSDPKDFLSRWSQRKLSPEAEKPAPAEKASPSGSDKNAVAPSASVPEFDITTLPSLESIGANSDIRAFLQRGVPAGLTHAALRRAWSADPAIRDFIGLSENSWDFNAPDSIPGFGSLSTDELKRGAAELFGKLTEETKAQAPQEDVRESEEITSEMKPEAELDSKPDSSALLNEQQSTDVAVQQDEPAAPSPTRHRHGRAIPE